MYAMKISSSIFKNTFYVKFFNNLYANRAKLIKGLHILKE